jgi:hypothetical protein
VIILFFCCYDDGQDWGESNVTCIPKMDLKKYANKKRRSGGRNVSTGVGVGDDDDGGDDGGGGGGGIEERTWPPTYPTLDTPARNNYHSPVASPSDTPTRTVNTISNPMSKTTISSIDVEMGEAKDSNGSNRSNDNNSMTGESKNREVEGEKVEEDESSLASQAIAGIGHGAIVVGRGLWNITSWGLSKVFNTGEDVDEQE